MESLNVPVCYKYPIVYKIEMEASSFDQIIQVYCDEILPNTTFANLEAMFVDYIISIVEPVGWKTVWRPYKKSCDMEPECDFVAEVFNVSLNTLDADIVIKSVIAPRGSELDLTVYQDKFEKDNWFTVPLIELYVICEGDEDEFYAKTAVAVEYARFFYKQLLRPWDEEEDIVFSEKILRPRLQLYFDMKNNTLPKVVISKIKSMLAEGWKISKRLKSLDSETNASDSECELSADDVMESVTLRTRLGELKTRMEILENPMIRSLVMNRYVPRRSKNKTKSFPVTYVVAEQFTHEMISNLSLEPSTFLEFDHNPESAFKSCSTGDKIMIFPGTYQCDTLGWLEGDIAVKGIGSPNEIILEATGNSEVFVNCLSPFISFQNLTLRSARGLLSTVVVHHGKVNMQNCIIDSDGAETGLLLLGGAEILLQDSEVCNSKEDGIQMRASSNVHLNSCKIVSCGGNGIQIDIADDGTVGAGLTEIAVCNSYIANNEGYGIFLNNAPIKEICLEKPEGDFSILQFFPWIRHSIVNTTISNNKYPGIGISSSCKPPSASTPKVYTKELLPASPPEDLEWSALSDFLGETSMSGISGQLHFSDIHEA